MMDATASSHKVLPAFLACIRIYSTDHILNKVPALRVYRL
jgi:hypothetical protein